jgi:hypothetical protein
MTSNIKTANIDTAFPVAGKDNPSQGFRDNFANIKAGLDTAKDEISTLQSTSAQLTQANDFSFVGSIERTTFRNTGYTAINAAAVTGTIDYSLGSYHKSAITADTTFQVTNWPADGIFATVRLEVAPTTAPININFSVSSGSVIANPETSLPYHANTTDPTIWDIWTSDNGATVYVKQVIGATSSSTFSFSSISANTINVAEYVSTPSLTISGATIVDNTSNIVVSGVKGLTISTGNAATTSTYVGINTGNDTGYWDIELSSVAGIQLGATFTMPSSTVTRVVKGINVAAKTIRIDGGTGLSEFSVPVGTVLSFNDSALLGSTTYAKAAPPTLKGSPGDRTGMVFATASTFYICYGTYDGTSDIWYTFTYAAPVQLYATAAPTHPVGAAGDFKGKYFAEDGGTTSTMFIYVCHTDFDSNNPTNPIWVRTAATNSW